MLYYIDIRSLTHPTKKKKKQLCIISTSLFKNSKIQKFIDKYTQS